MKILITGAAGFVGYHLSLALLNKGMNEIVGVDNMNEYYDVQLKKDRIAILSKYDFFDFKKMDISNIDQVMNLFSDYKFDIVINLAAQAGVRYSIDHPEVYMQSNLIGFYNILEACRKFPVNHLIYASSSSVYGANKKVPFSEDDRVDHPVSLYAATKKANELLAYTYAHLYNIPSTGLRFFTVYGPFGRPDMAYFKFTDMYFSNEAIHIFNDGDFEKDLYRDFTYIDDVVMGLIELIDNAPKKSSDSPAYEIYNIGNETPIKLMDFISNLEQSLEKSLNRPVSFKKVFEPIKPGDVPATYATTQKLFEKVAYKPSTSISEGLQKFTDWYVEYYGKH